MTGVLFIVNIPQKLYENELRKRVIKCKLFVEKDKFDNTSKIVSELKENKQFSLKSVESFAQDDNSIARGKCKSTDCLNPDDKGIHKSKSEINLSTESISEQKSGIKTHWDEIKQAIKPKKNKLKITQPARGADVLSAFRWDTAQETILAEVISRLGIANETWTATKDNHFWQVSFTLESSNLCEELLQVFRSFGIGSRFQSSVSVIPCTLYYQGGEDDDGEASEVQSETNSAWNRFSSSVRARSNLAQVLHEVRADAALTFDWLFLLMVAASVAAIGLIENSTVVLVASMLISPLMAPITAFTMGTAVRDNTLQRMGILHEMLGLLVCVIIGFVYGLAISGLEDIYGVVDWPSDEMNARSRLRSLWVGVLIAVPSGVGVAIAILGEYTSSLVGVAISASLLPPAVNAGLLWAMSLIHLLYEDDPEYATELAAKGSVSLCLTFVNIVCIFIVGVIVYKVKEVNPLHKRDLTWWKSSYQPTISNADLKDVSPATWDIYSKWCNENREEKDSATGDEVPSQVQSDTVTYRRHTARTQRLRAQNIEAYCLRKAQMNQSYMPLDTKLKQELKSDSELRGESPKPLYDINEHFKSLKLAHDYNPNVDYSTRYSFHNACYQDKQDEDNGKEHKEGEADSPTIEPSVNVTVETKKPVILDSKMYNV